MAPVDCRLRPGQGAQLTQPLAGPTTTYSKSPKTRPLLDRTEAVSVLVMLLFHHTSCSFPIFCPIDPRSGDLLLGSEKF